MKSANVKREITFLQEYNIDDYNIIKDQELFCLDSFMKYKLCLSIFIQGKIINNRFRIPTIDEYLLCEKIDSLPLSKNDFKKQIAFIKYIKLNLFDIVKNFYNLTGIKSSSSGYFIYLNGVSVATNVNLTAGGAASRNLRIAHRERDGAAGYFPGYIPSVKIYNVALTASQVQQNFNALRGRFGIE